MRIPTLSFMCPNAWSSSQTNHTSKCKSISSKYTGSSGPTASKSPMKSIAGSTITTNDLLFRGRKINGKKLISNHKVEVSFAQLKLPSTITLMPATPTSMENPSTSTRKTKPKSFIFIVSLKVPSIKSITSSIYPSPGQPYSQHSQQSSKRNKSSLPRTTKIQMSCWWKLYFRWFFPWSGIISTYQTYQ